MPLESSVPASDHGAPRRSHDESRDAHDVPHRELPPPLEKDYLVQRRPVLGSRQSSTVSIAQINQVVSDDKIDTETYGVSEIREGFFDALFLKPAETSEDELRDYAKTTLPRAFDKANPLAPKHFLATQMHEMHSLFLRVTTTRSGIRLIKSFSAFFIAYVLCLIPVVRTWLGRYSYIMTVSVILNHPARSVGSQIEGAIMTIVGTAAGLGWGVIGLLLSTSTLSASAGFGGILAMFLAIFMAVIAWGRSFFVKFHQGVLCAGIAITFTTLAETSSRDIQWIKLWSYGLPWVMGQVIALAINLLIYPDAGARPLADTIYQFYNVVQDALVIPRPRDVKVRRLLAKTYVDLSTAARDMRLDITVTRFSPDDFSELRNLMQAVIRALLTMETETFMFSDGEDDDAIAITINPPTSPMSDDSKENQSQKPSASESENASRRVMKSLAGPTQDILTCMREGLRRSHAALMELSGYRKHMGPSSDISSDVGPLQIRLKTVLSAFDAVEATLLHSGELHPSSLEETDVVQLFIFARHVREAAAAVQTLLNKVDVMQSGRSWPRVYLPSYPFWKSLHRTNRQVRHDRGGITAGSYQVTFSEIAELLDKIKSREHKPAPRTRPSTPEPDENMESSHPTMDAEKDRKTGTEEEGKGYKIWRVLHRLQGFESRYALKVCLVTSLLSVPSYLDGHDWWDQYEVWWAVSISWIMIHPRVGGNVQDLVTRALCAVLGAVWAGAAYAAGNGNPYVLAVFSAIFMIPMTYRYTQSSHPRSGIIGCLSFTVISLSLQYTNDNSTALTAVIKGLSFLVGTVVPVVLNWVLWPFVARHELRFALSSMLFFMSIIYRSKSSHPIYSPTKSLTFAGVVSRYVYFEEGQEPTPEDIQRSEMLEGRLREGFVRIRQLLVLTRHEIRLRAPFDPLPYSALADACERFFEYLIAVRQSAMFYNPGYIRDNTLASEKLLGYRRDAVAAILGNLYILAGALRSQRPVPRYLPSAAAARKKLLLRTIELENEMAAFAEQADAQEHKKFSDIYSYSYKESLTGCAAQLEELEKYTKLIVGEQGFEEYKDDDESDDHEDS